MSSSPPAPDQPSRRFPLAGPPAPPPPDHYQILQVDPRAAPEVIAAAFRALLRLRHPDVSADPLADAHTRQLLDVARTLGHPAARAAYDTGLRRRAVRLDEIEQRLAPRTLDVQQRRLAEEVVVIAEDYDRLWDLLDGPRSRWASDRLERQGERCRAALRELVALPAWFDDGAASVIVPSGLGEAVGGYLAALEETLAGRQAEAAGRLLAALRREHSEEIAGAFAAFGEAAVWEEERLACYRPHYVAALARARYLAAALG